MTKRYVAKKSFGYNNRMLDLGQVVELAGLVNDHKLVGLGYFQEAPANAKTVQCHCGAEFLEEWQREAHGEIRHPATAEEKAEAPGRLRATRQKSVLETA